MSFFIEWVKKKTGSLPAPGLCKVISVKDGDSFVVEQNTALYDVRLSGIDCPELAQPYGLQAQMYLSDIIYQQQIFIAPQKFGKYSRVIAFAYFENMSINEHLVMTGNCWVYEKYAPKQLLEWWLHLQSIAKEQRYGLWSHAEPIEPRIFRRSLYNY